MTIRRILRLVAIVLTLLLIPFIGMQLNTDIHWSTADFVSAAIVLVGAGTTYEFIRTHLITPRQRILTGIGIVVIVFVSWVELAVGVFGTPFAGS